MCVYMHVHTGGGYGYQLLVQCVVLALPATVLDLCGGTSTGAYAHMCDSSGGVCVNVCA